MNSLARRLHKLERLKPDQDDLRLRTWDELNVRILELCFVPGSPTDAVQSQVADDETDLAFANQILERIQYILKDISDAHAMRSKSNYADHMTRIATEWKFRHNRSDPYVPALLEDEYDGFEYPDLMARRAAVRSNPVVMSVLAMCESGAIEKFWVGQESSSLEPGEPSDHPPDYPPRAEHDHALDVEQPGGSNSVAMGSSMRQGDLPHIADTGSTARIGP